VSPELNPRQKFALGADGDIRVGERHSCLGVLRRPGRFAESKLLPIMQGKREDNAVDGPIAAGKLVEIGYIRCGALPPGASQVQSTPMKLLLPHHRNKQTIRGRSSGPSWLGRSSCCWCVASWVGKLAGP